MTSDEPHDRSDDGADTLADEATRPESDWPVDEKYLVVPSHDEAGAADSVEGGPTGETVAGPTAAAPPERPQRRLFGVPPDLRPGLLLVLLAALLAIGVAALLSTRGEGGTAAPETSPTTTAPTTTGDTTTEPATQSVSLPSVVGRDVDAALEMLEKAGLRGRVARQPSDEPDGRVLEQSPPAETEVERGTAVALTVSGEPPVTVPDVVGETLSSARTELREAGLRARFRRVESSKQPDTVLSQHPSAGDDLERGGAVTLEVARRAPPALVQVPSLEGLRASDASARVRELGLRSSVVSVQSDEERGTVVRQSPRAGAEVRTGSTVTLRVSTGPASVSVPDVTGQSESSARSQLTAAGFQVQTTDQPTADPAEDGVVLSQAPSPGTRAQKGSVVTITVGRFQ